MTLDHIGIAVPSLAPALQAWQSLFGYRQVSAAIANSRQKVRVAFLSAPDGGLVKLVEPSAPESPIARFTMRGGGLHHLCFRCDDLGESMAALRDAGARILVPPQPGEAFCNHAITFLIVPGNLNIELIDTAEKALFTPRPSLADR